jgi:hypothetical protein
MKTRALITMTMATLAAVGCSTSTPIGALDNGGASGGSPMAAGGTSGSTMGIDASTPKTQGPYVPSPSTALDDQPFTNPSGVSGDWVGYLEGYSFYFQGSDALRFHFGVDAQGHDTLTIVRGMGVVPPAPTDPFQAWPSALIDDGGGPGPGESYPEEPVAGFAYTAHDVTWQGSRLQLATLSSEPWAAWCGLQTSYPVPGSPTNYSCNEGSGAKSSSSDPSLCIFTDAPDPKARCTWNHYEMCNGLTFCDCNATGCGAAVEKQIPFDITFEGAQADGVMGIYHLHLAPATH